MPINFLDILSSPFLTSSLPLSVSHSLSLYISPCLTIPSVVQPVQQFLSLFLILKCPTKNIFLFFSLSLSFYNLFFCHLLRKLCVPKGLSLFLLDSFCPSDALLFLGSLSLSLSHSILFFFHSVVRPKIFVIITGLGEQDYLCVASSYVVRYL